MTDSDQNQHQNRKQLKGWQMDTPIVEQPPLSATTLESNVHPDTTESAPHSQNYFIRSGVWSVATLLFALWLYGGISNDNGLVFALTWATFGAIFLVPFVTGIVALFYFVKGVANLIRS